MVAKSHRFDSIRSSKQSQRTAVVAPVVLDSSLVKLGWNQQLETQLKTVIAELQLSELYIVARISAHHRNLYQLLSTTREIELPISKQLPSMTVGDWVLLDCNHQFIHLFNRNSLFKRKASGSKLDEQFIAANLDWVFIVSSLNDDFNLNRIERYLSLVNEAQVTPVVVLTKMDLCDDVTAYINTLRKLDTTLLIEVVNSLDKQSISTLFNYCKQGSTVALIGSSGVGKSTLVNSLLDENKQLTSGIREDDAKGRHTTTGRSLHLMESGGLLLDTPGMRELQLSDCEQGVSQTFSDIIELANRCRFGDCQHLDEPGCAVQEAIAVGDLMPRRLLSYQKLLREQALNGATLAQKRAQGKAMSKYYKRVQANARVNKRGD